MTTKKMERETSVIRAPSDGSEVGVCNLANPEDVRAALDANVRVSDAARKMPSHERATALRKIADGMQGIRPELARTLALEAGKSINQARLEIDRTIDVFRDRSEERRVGRGGGVRRWRHRWRCDVD